MDRSQDLQRVFLEAYDAYADALFRHCYFRLFDRERAKEMVQETFTKVWDQMRRGVEIQYMRAFLYRVLNNLLIDLSRRKTEESLDRMQDDGFDPASMREDPLAFTMRILSAEELSRALAQLEEPYRQAVVMRYIDEWTPQEIAAELGETANVISVRIHRGIARLRKLIPVNGQPFSEDNDTAV